MVRLYLILALIPVALLLYIHPAYAQRLDRNTKQQITQNIGDLRASFDTIISLRDKQVAQEAALYYRELWQKDTENPKLQALYAFAWEVGSAFFPYDTQTPTQKKYRAQLEIKSFESYHCREESFKQLSTTPEVILMYALYKHQNGSNFAESLRLAERASKLAPD